MNIETKQQHVEATMRLAPVIPVVIIEDARHAVPMARALVAGGIPAIEVTLRTPAALDAIRAIAQEVEGAVVGVGTVLMATVPTCMRFAKRESGQKNVGYPQKGVNL